MKTDLDHLPPQKQRELERVVQLIFEEFDDASKAKSLLSWTPRRSDLASIIADAWAWHSGHSLRRN